MKSGLKSDLDIHPFLWFVNKTWNIVHYIWTVLCLILKSSSWPSLWLCGTDRATRAVFKISMFHTLALSWSVSVFSLCSLFVSTQVIKCYSCWRYTHIYVYHVFLELLWVWKEILFVDLVGVFVFSVSRCISISLFTTLYQSIWGFRPVEGLTGKTGCNCGQLYIWKLYGSFMLTRSSWFQWKFPVNVLPLFIWVVLYFLHEGLLYKKITEWRHTEVLPYLLKPQEFNRCKSV